MTTNTVETASQVNSLDLAQVRQTTLAVSHSVNAYLKEGWKILAVLKQHDGGNEYVQYELAWVSDEPARRPNV